MNTDALTPNQAARAFQRIWEPIDLSLGEAATYDAGFDGGEWSGPAHATIREKQLDACLARVAPLMGYDPDDLFRAWERWGYESEFRRMTK